MGNAFYVYVHLRADTGAPFYVGKGSHKRAWSKACRSKWWHNTVEKHGYDVSIVARDMTERAAFALEVALISEYGRENLVNLTDGGEGCAGAVRSEVTRKRLSEVNKGKTSPRKGCALSDETKAKISAAIRAKRPAPMSKKADPQETKEKLRLARSKRVGSNAPCYDSRIHTFWHADYGELKATQFDLRTNYNLPQGNMSALMSGRQKSLRGWMLIEKGEKE